MSANVNLQQTQTGLKVSDTEVDLRPVLTHAVDLLHEARQKAALSRSDNQYAHLGCNRNDQQLTLGCGFIRLQETRILDNNICFLPRGVLLRARINRRPSRTATVWHGARQGVHISYKAHRVAGDSSRNARSQGILERNCC